MHVERTAMTVSRYVVRRLFHAAFVVWAAFTTSFVLLYLLPSDPVELMLGRAGGESVVEVSEEVKAALRADLGLDQPALLQYFSILARFLAGQFGTSIRTGRPIVDMLSEALPHTLALAAFTLVLAVVIGAAIAFAAVRLPIRALRTALESLPPLLVALPTFWVGLLALQLFSFRWQLFPAVGNDGFASLVLPALTLAVPTGAYYAQVLITGLTEAGEQPFVPVAVAKGLAPRRVFLAHVVPNGILPTLTVVGMSVGSIVAGSVVAETVFSRIGLGRMVQTAVEEQDIPVVQAVVVIAAVGFALSNLIVDLLYPAVDPRLRNSVRRAAEVGA